MEETIFMLLPPTDDPLLQVVLLLLGKEQVAAAATWCSVCSMGQTLHRHCHLSSWLNRVHFTPLSNSLSAWFQPVSHRLVCGSLCVHSHIHTYTQHTSRWKRLALNSIKFNQIKWWMWFQKCYIEQTDEVIFSANSLILSRWQLIHEETSARNVDVRRGRRPNPIRAPIAIVFIIIRND